MTELAANPATLPYVRQRVKELLVATPAFHQLAPQARHDLAHAMVKVANYIAGGERPGDTPAAVTLANPAPAPRPAARQQAFDAAAAVQGVESYKNLVQTVDFPKFVAGLIDGVFNAIVGSSIKQMEAYAELVKNVAKSVDEFMRDNTTDNQARDWLAGKYPDYLEVDTEGEAPRLKPKEGHDEDTLPNFFADLGLKEPVTSIDEDNVEEQLVPAARRRMAMDRQQLLATMVLMGINRLVVTNGSISASVLFELNTEDTLTRHRQRASDYDSHYTRNYKAGEEYGAGKSDDGGLWYKGNWSYDSSRSANFKVSTVRNDDATDRVELHGKLAGKVDLRFKSDYFPLERMTEILPINRIQQQQAASAAVNQAAGGAQPPIPQPPMPVLPPAPAAPLQPAQPPPAAPAGTGGR